MRYLKKTAIALMLCFFPLLALGADVNVNTASKNKLMSELEGLTEQQAESIIQYREKQGPFVHLNELDTIEGIGRDVIAPNYERLTVGDVDWGDKKS